MHIVSHSSLTRLHPTSSHHHPETEQRLTVLLDALGVDVEGATASREQIALVHDSSYVDLIAGLAVDGWLDGDTLGGPTTWEAAALAAGCSVQAARSGGFALVRPPGHHALTARAMGFCIFGNVAIAARVLQREDGIERVAILDWDVHHGNGTEAIFRGDESVLFVSLHEWPFYPGTGGPGTSDETTLNIPLPAGSGDDEYLESLDRLVEPAVRSFAPDLLLVSAGFDAHVDDPLAGMEVTADGFRAMAERAAAMAPRVAAVLEGGYNLTTLPSLVEAALQGFGGR